MPRPVRSHAACKHKPQVNYHFESKSALWMPPSITSSSSWLARIGHLVVGPGPYAAGTREILEDWFAGKPIRSEYLIVEGGKFAGTGAASYAQ
jgi:hypothetical protein